MMSPNWHRKVFGSKLSPKKDLICNLYDIGAIKFGNFTFKSGITSPIYIDLRVSMSYPRIAAKISDFIWELIPKAIHDSADMICGVPYGALHYANCLSQKHTIPMIMVRKEVKEHGTKKLIEGTFKPGQSVIVIEDTITTGGSVQKVVDDLTKEGLNVLHVGIFFSHNRFKEEDFSFNLSYVLDIEDILKTLAISNRFYHLTSYEDRAKITTNKKIKTLLGIMTKKKTNLALSVDLSSSREILKIVSEVAPYICMVKTHIDTIEDAIFCNLPQKLKELATEYNFMILEDRKFADIAHITQKQYTAGPFHINQWADFVTCHAIAGPNTIEILNPSNVIILGQMSSKDNLASMPEYTNAATELGESLGVAGFVSQRRLSNNPSILTFTPGISIAAGDDAKGQMYKTPQHAMSNGSDVLIVGREITLAHSPSSNAKVLRDQGWKGYEKRLKDLDTIDMLLDSS